MGALTKAERDDLAVKFSAVAHGVAGNVARQFRLLDWLDVDDLHAQAMLELMIALEQYDPNRVPRDDETPEVSCRAYCGKRLQYRLIDYVRRQHGRPQPKVRKPSKSGRRMVNNGTVKYAARHAASLDETLPDGRLRHEVADLDPGYEKVEDAMLTQQIIEWAEATASPRDCHLFLSQAGQPRQATQLAAVYGVTQSRVSHLRKKWNGMAAARFQPDVPVPGTGETAA